jgi:hypothetical protein
MATKKSSKKKQTAPSERAQYRLSSLDRSVVELTRFRFACMKFDDEEVAACSA